MQNYQQTVTSPTFLETLTSRRQQPMGRGVTKAFVTERTLQVALTHPCGLEQCFVVGAVPQGQACEAVPVQSHCLHHQLVERD